MLSQPPATLHHVASFEVLYDAWRRARRAKAARPPVSRFALDAEPLLFEIQRALLARSWRHGRYRTFTIYDRKPRIIAAAPFRDRVVHHALMAVAEAPLSASFIPHSYACRAGKGTHRAVATYQRWARANPYVLKLDVASYFPSIRHADLLAMIEARVADDGLRWLFERILASWHSLQGRGRGLPIGNLTSQCLANVYLDGLDHFVTRELGVRCYLRYVDDLVLLGRDKAQLWQAATAIERQLGELGLTLKPSATQLSRTGEWVDLLGYRVTPFARRMRPGTGHRARRRLRALGERYRRGACSLDDVRAAVHAWLGHLDQGDSRALAGAVLGELRLSRSASAAVAS